jgi:hypothetical protein
VNHYDWLCGKTLRCLESWFDKLILGIFKKVMEFAAATGNVEQQNSPNNSRSMKLVAE